MEKTKSINELTPISPKDVFKGLRKKITEKKNAIIEEKFNAWLYDENNIDRYINNLTSEKIINAMSEYHLDNKADNLYHITQLFAKQYNFEIHKTFNVIENIVKKYFEEK